MKFCPNRLRTVLTIFLTLTLFLAACGGGDGGTEFSAAADGSPQGEAAPASSTDDGGEQAAPAEGDAGGDDPFAALDNLDDGELPLEALLGIGAGADENAQALERERVAQEFIRTCMAEQGFEYTPLDPAVYLGFEGGVDGLGELEYAQQFGYGISTSFDAELDRFDGPDAVVDPNQERLEAMSEPERVAYEQALWGDAPEFDPTIDDSEREDFDFEPGGCEGEAFAKAYPEDAVYEQFGDEIDELEDRIMADPRVVEILEIWRGCMADRGFVGLEGPGDAENEIFARMDPIFEAAFGDNVMFGGDEDNMDIQITGDSPTNGPQLSREARAELDELQAYEISVAVADVECRDGLEDTYLAVAAEYERQFIDENRAELEAFVN